MSSLISNINDPDRLILAWQAPDQFGDRQRWAVGELVRDSADAILTYYDASTFAALNNNQAMEKLRSYGFAGYPAFPSTRSTFASALGAFMRRLPPRNRADFNQYLRHLRIAPEVNPSDFALLGLSEAQLPSDGFSLVDPLDSPDGPIELLNEIAGFRYYCNDIGIPAIGQHVNILAEDNNKYDPQAVMIEMNGRKMGNINRLQAPAFRRWLSDKQLSAHVERVNGTPDRPRIFLFVTVR